MILNIYQNKSEEPDVELLSIIQERKVGHYNDELKSLMKKYDKIDKKNKKNKKKKKKKK